MPEAEAEAIRRLRVGLMALQRASKAGHAGISTLLRLVCAARVSLAGVFDAELWREDGYPPTALLSRKANIHSNRTVDWASVRNQVGELLANRKFSSAAELSREIGISLHGVGADGNRLVAEHTRAVRTEIRSREYSALVQRMREAIEMLGAAGTRVSARAVSELLHTPPGSEHFRRLYRPGAKYRLTIVGSDEKPTASQGGRFHACSDVLLKAGRSKVLLKSADLAN